MQTDHKIYDRIWIIDSTLRDGEQTPGVAFSDKEKEEIAIRLNDIGISEIEVGTPAMGKNEISVIKHIMKHNLSCRISSWCRAVPEDIKSAAEAGTDAVHISHPVSDLQLAVFGKNTEWLFESVEKMVSLAKKYFQYISVGAQDATRTDPLFLMKYADFVFKCGANRIRIADTVGIATPLYVHGLISSLRKELPENVEIEFHAHNDLGMATANSLTALQSGADAVSVTVNGLGERAGNAALEEVAAAIELDTRLSSTINCGKLKSLSDFIAAASGKAVHQTKPIVGSDIFVHESGIHFNGQQKDRLCYQPFLPEKFGMEEEKYVLGKHSGSFSIQFCLSTLGISITREEAGTLLDHVRKMSQLLKRNISISELSELYYSKIAGL